MAQKVLYPGSFDPITLGHVDIVRRLAAIFPDVTVLIANSEQKNYWFSAVQRRDMVEQAVTGITGVRVDMFGGLTVDYARRVGARVIVRGLRAVSDFEFETAVANINKTLYPEIETLILLASPDYAFYSSRLVKEVAQFGGELAAFVPPHVIAMIRQKQQKGTP
jgi:pantetheine-phosphate adenylyltransferase